MPERAAADQWAAKGAAPAEDRAGAREALRAARGGMHAAGWGQVLQDWYVGLFVTATLLVMLFAATGPSILRPDCATATCLTDAHHLWLAGGMALLGSIAAMLGLRAAGPAWADRGQATWLLSTPADRGVLLRGGILRVGFVAVVATAAWGVLAGFALVVGLGRESAPVAPIAACALAGAVVAVLLTALALWRQGGAVLPGRAARAVPDAELLRAGESPVRSVPRRSCSTPPPSRCSPPDAGWGVAGATPAGRAPGERSPAGSSSRSARCSVAGRGSSAPSSGAASPSSSACSSVISRGCSSPRSSGSSLPGSAAGA